MSSSTPPNSNFDQVAWNHSVKTRSLCYYVPRQAIGALLFIISIFYIVFFTYAIVISKIFPVSLPSSIPTLESHLPYHLIHFAHVLLHHISVDKHYCVLIPLSLPIFWAVVYVNWLGYKLFIHNK